MCVSVCLSVPSTDSSSEVRLVCRAVRRRQQISIDIIAGARAADRVML